MSRPPAGPAPARRIRDYFRRHLLSFGLGVACLIGTQAAALAVPPLLKQATDALLEGRPADVKNAALWMLFLAVVGSVIRILSRVLIFNSGRRVEYDLRQECFDHLMALSPRFYAGMPLAQVMSRLVNDLTQVRLLLGPGLLNLTNTALVYVVVLPLLFYQDWSLTVFALMPLPALFFLGRAFSKRLFTYSREAQDRLGTLSAKVQESLSGVMTVRAFRQEAHEERVFLGLNEQYLEINVRLARLRGFMFPLMGLAGAIGTVVVLGIGGQRIAEDRMTVGDYVQYSAYLAALTWPTIALGWMMSLWQRGLASMERLNEIFRAPPSIVDGPLAPAPGPGRLELRHLTFSYGEKLPQALTGVSLTIEPGQRVVVVGRTGSGKSTLLRALSRLVEIERGQYFLDGVDVMELPLDQVRRMLGYAPQEAFLFSRSLEENVAFGDPGADVSRIDRAIATAGLSPDLPALPEGKDTVVGERGVTLSGGQRQRTTLARAILPGAKVLLLDDVLSAVDTETEAKILAALEAERSDRTVIIATHRLACAAKADRVVVLDRGQVVETGTEAELLAQGGLYAQMYRRQRLLDEVEAAKGSRDLHPEATPKGDDTPSGESPGGRAA